MSSNHMYSANFPLADNPVFLASSPATEVSTINSGDYVIKSRVWPYTQEREANETDEIYYDRRLKFCFEYIEAQRSRQENAMQYIPDEIIAPSEYFFIADGEDNFPALYSVQERVHGKSLKETDLEKVKAEHKEDLLLLLKANRESYFKTGQCLDLVGRSSNTDKNKRSKFFNPLGNSENIFLTIDGKIALIDTEFITLEDWKYQLGKFISIEIAYWDLMLNATSKWKNLRQKIF